MGNLDKIRADDIGQHKTAFDKNRKRILATQSICGICGRPVDKSLRYPNPMAPSIDHIIPIDRGGHPSDIDNLQLAHWTCNRQKSDKLLKERKDTEALERASVLSNRNLPQSRDWTRFGRG
jgi:5-methylcytosine-specific restriction endonuclease McrA